MRLPVGTKSILFGAHCWFIHPWFVALAWKRLYGWPLDPRLWLAFVIHDWGYWGSPNMDGAEGERHVEWAATVMRRLFGIGWGNFCLYHSRFYAVRDGQPFSRLCVADKLAFCLTPRWLYLPMVNWSGEIHEYIELARKRTAGGEPKYASMKLSTSGQESWWNDVCEYLERWVAAHKDGAEDTWTPRLKEAQENG